MIGTAHEAAPALLTERRRFGEELGLAVHEAAGIRRAVQARVAKESIRAPAERVRAAARDHVHDAARRGAELRAERVGQDLKLLHPVLREGGRLLPVELPHGRRAVDEDAVGERALAVERQRLARPAGAVAAGSGGDPRRQEGQRAEITLDHRQVVDLFFLDDRRHGASRRLHQSRVADDGDVFLDGAERHPEIEADLLPDLEDDARAANAAESGQLDRDFVLACREVRQVVLPELRRDGGLDGVGGDMPRGHGRAGQHRALFVGDLAANRGQGDLRVAGCRRAGRHTRAQRVPQQCAFS